MNIAIDASRTTVARRTGTENYALQLIRALLQPGARSLAHTITLFFRDKPSVDALPDVPGVIRRIIPARRLWTHARFAAALWASRPDVTFVPAHTLPFLFPGKAVVTIHDLGYRHFPAAHPLKERLYLEFTTRFSAGRATCIIADSEATKKDLISAYRVKPDKIDVIYPGVEGIARASDAQTQTVRGKFRLPERYLLFLGTLQPRKNITRLCAAFASYLGSSADPSLGLVLAGQLGWKLDMQRNVFASLPGEVRQRITMTGYVADDEVAALYSGALALVFPSLYEGFGFPVIEAMRCGVPVLCSNTSSLPELAGDAAVLVDPLDVAQIAAGIRRLVNDSALRASLILRGAKQAEQFTWERAARQTLSTLERAVQ